MVDGVGTYSPLDEKPVGWKTIDSAPGDSETEVLLWYPSTNSMTFGITFKYTSGEVRASSSFKGSQPSHWMPLPEPPSKGA